MALAEFRLDGRTYLFDAEHVPEGAELVTSDDAPNQPIAPAPKRRRKPANKAAPAPEDKGVEPESTED